MKINRNLAISLAVALLIIIALVVTQFSGDGGSSVATSTEATATTEPTSEASPVTKVSESSSEQTSATQDPNPKKLIAGSVWTYDCEIPVQLPESIYLTCADGGWYIYNLML